MFGKKYIYIRIYIYIHNSSMINKQNYIVGVTTISHYACLDQSEHNQ